MHNSETGRRERRGDSVPSPFLVALSIGTLWLVGGLVYPMLAIASDSLTAIQLTAVRTTGAVLMTTPFLLFRSGSREHLRSLFSWRTLWPNIVAGVMFYPIGNGLLTWASARLPSSLSALSFSLLPVLAAAVAALRGHRLGRWVWSGIGAASISMLVVVGAPDADVQLIPLFAALASVLCWFAGTEYWASRGISIDLLSSVWVQLVVGSIACWVSVALAGDGVPASDVWVQPLIVLLAFSQFIQHAAYLGMAGRISPVLLTSFAFVNPVVAAIAGYLLLEQRLTAVQLAASAVLLVAVSLVVRFSTSPQAAADDVTRSG